MKETNKAICFGEVLWDIFPDKERIGGAPLNVASRLSSLGVQTGIISKVGTDKKGADILSYLESRKVNIRNVTSDDIHATGVVKVSLSGGGSATYDISYPSAWDKIELTEEMAEAVEESDVFIFGSLACRDEVSRNTLFKLLPKASFKVLDFNLRPPYYTTPVLLRLIKNADFIKFNDDELYEIAALLKSPYHSLEQNLLFIAEKYDVKSICVTKGGHGAVLFSEKKLFYNSGYRIRVKDTVGAGDSFLATLLAGLLKKEKPQVALDHACAVGALVAAEEGANPRLDAAMVRQFMHPRSE